ncbi:MAG: PAS domain-containing protein, partial [bacterium]|nr:PAS domain-containing protein [bacterium]
ASASGNPKANRSVRFGPLGVGTALLDAESGRILYANDAFCRSLNYDPGEISGKGVSLKDIVHPDDRSAYVSASEGVLSRVVGRSRFDARYAARNGLFFTMRTTLTLLPHSSGQPSRMTCVLDDVATPALTSQGELATVSVWNWTPETGDEQRPAGYQILFGSSHAVSHPSIEQLTAQVHPDDTKAVQLMLRRSLTGARGTQDYRRLGGDGQTRWIRETVTPIKDRSGTVTNVVGMSVDVTAGREGYRESTGLLAFIRYLEKHWDEPLVLTKVARDHKLSVRTLQKYFDALGITPLDFLKRIRLAHAFDLLSTPDPRTTVTRVSRRCGFGNLGHFAKDYRSEFGELPSETLLRNRTQTGNAEMTAAS